MVTVTQLVVVGEGRCPGAIIYGPMILAILLYLPLILTDRSTPTSLILTVRSAPGSQQIHCLERSGNPVSLFANESDQQLQREKGSQTHAFKREILKDSQNHGTVDNGSRAPAKVLQMFHIRTSSPP